MARQLSNVFEPPAPKQSGRLASLPGGRPVSTASVPVSATTSKLTRTFRPWGSQALFAFGLSLVAYTLQTEAAQYVQQGLGYRKPFLSLSV